MARRSSTPFGSLRIHAWTILKFLDGYAVNTETRELGEAKCTATTIATITIKTLATRQPTALIVTWSSGVA
ncbi:MAG: hypothetical protein WAV72_18300 [Bradyrhizobium sp.]